MVSTLNIRIFLYNVHLCVFLYVHFVCVIDAVILCHLDCNINI